jgi:hypothetical protein
MSLLLTLFLLFTLFPVVFILLLIYVPKPVPDRWEVRLFLLMGMPADQFLSFIIKVGVCVGVGVFRCVCLGVCVGVGVSLYMCVYMYR